MKLDQSKAPVLEALERMKTQRLVPFDVPGHKRGKGNPDLTAIKEAEELAADAFGAAHAFFMVGGTTSAVQSMVLSVCKRGEKIILPRKYIEV